MTPSQWEQGTSLRHDAMQADVLEFLRGMNPAPQEMKRDGRIVMVERIRIDSEHLLALPSGQILTFVDIVDWWGVRPFSESRHNRNVYVYEIKPTITSCGAIVRQLKATEHAFERWLESTKTPAKVRVAPVVPVDDPNLPLLRRLWAGAVFMWDAEAKVLV